MKSQPSGQRFHLQKPCTSTRTRQTQRKDTRKSYPESPKCPVITRKPDQSHELPEKCELQPEDTIPCPQTGKQLRPPPPGAEGMGSRGRSAQPPATELATPGHPLAWAVPTAPASKGPQHHHATGPRTSALTAPRPWTRNACHGHAHDPAPQRREMEGQPRERQWLRGKTAKPANCRIIQPYRVPKHADSQGLCETMTCSKQEPGSHNPQPRGDGKEPGSRGGTWESTSPSLKPSQLKPPHTLTLTLSRTCLAPPRTRNQLRKPHVLPKTPLAQGREPASEQTVRSACGVRARHPETWKRIPPGVAQDSVHHPAGLAPRTVHCALTPAPRSPTQPSAKHPRATAE